MVITSYFLHGQIPVTPGEPVTLPADWPIDEPVVEVYLETDAPGDFSVSELILEVCVEYVGGY